MSPEDYSCYRFLLTPISYLVESFIVLGDFIADELFISLAVMKLKRFFFLIHGLFHLGYMCGLKYSPVRLLDETKTSIITKQLTNRIEQILRHISFTTHQTTSFGNDLISSLPSQQVKL